MFTGIIAAIGVVERIETGGDWIVTVEAPSSMEDLAIGASVACDGVCLTVIEKAAGRFKVQLSSETLSLTTARAWRVGTRLNLERALRMGDELGGHLVFGHVDGIATIVSREPEKDSLRYRFEIPEAFALYLAPKGSITLDGVSLTVNDVRGRVFGVNVIPHTQAETTLGGKGPGDFLNFEVDAIARYVGAMLKARGDT